MACPYRAGRVSNPFIKCPPGNLKPPQFGRSRGFLNSTTMPFWPRSDFSVGIYPVPSPPGIHTVTTNVPMDGNDPRGGRDWQWAEWDQELKVSEESRGLSEEYKIKTGCKVGPQLQHGLSWDMGTTPTPKLCLQSFPPGQRGQVTHEALLAAGFAPCYLMPGWTMLGTN